MTSITLQQRVDAVPFWFHSIDLGQGIVTPGYKSPATLRTELARLRLPNLEGKTVLDVNTWDGFYAFEAERRGASAVTALDFFAWSLELDKHFAWLGECMAKGIDPGGVDQWPHRRPKDLPGKIGFDTAHEILGSSVKPVVGDFMETDLDELGQFDVTFFLGSLYHMQNPFESLKRLARVTKEMAVIETEAAEFPGLGAHALCEFFEGDELVGDVTNWWSPNRKAVEGMCRAAGFRRVEMLHGARIWSRFGILARARNIWMSRPATPVWRYRAILHAYK